MSELYGLPKGWEWKKLGKVLDVQNGYAFDSKLFNEEIGVQLIRIRDLKNGVITESKYSGEYDDKFLVYSGDFLIGMDGDFVCYIWKGEPSLLNQRVCRLVDFSSDLEAKYIFYGINKYLEYIHKTTSFVTVKHISSKQIKDIDFPLPPLKEQKKIVGKLDLLFSKIDKAIELHQKNIDEADIFMASVLNDIFEELEEKHNLIKISDIAYIKGGKRLPKGEKLQENKTDYPYIRVADFLDTGIINLKTIQYITKEIQEQIKNYTINSKNLYISIAGTIGKTGIIQQELDGANLTENAVKLVYKIEDISNKFVYYLTNSSSFKERIGIATKTVAQPKLAITRLAEVEIPIPPLETQKKVVLYLDEISNKIEKIKELQKSKMQSLKELKASILDKAFRGEL